jgi:hypothetical protein
MATSLIDFNALRPNAAMEAYQQGQQNQLAQMQLSQQQQAIRDAEAEREAYKAAGNDYAKLQQELFTRGLGKQGLAVGAARAKMQSDKIALLKDQTALMENTAKQIMQNPEAAEALVQRYGQQTGANVDFELGQFQAARGNPEKIKQLASSYALKASEMLPKFQQFSTPGGGMQIGTTDYTGKFTPAQTLAPQMTPYEKAQTGLRAQEVGLRAQEVARASSPELQQKLAQARAMGEAAGKGDAAALQAYPKAIAQAEQTVGLIDQMIGKRDSTGKLMKGEKTHPGFQWAVGAGISPTFTMGGTDTADFQKLFDQVSGGAFLQAFEALKGGGAITEKEGAKGTAALTRMNLAQSEKEFVKAALEFQDVVKAGAARAQERAVKVTGAAPAPAVPTTPAGTIKFLGFEESK